MNVHRTDVGDLIVSNVEHLQMFHELQYLFQRTVAELQTRVKLVSESE